MERETAETKFLATSSNSVVKTCTSFLPSPQSENSLEIDADNSLQLSTAALLIGTTLGLLRPSTQSLTDNTPSMRFNLESKSIWTLSARCLWRSTIQCLKPLRDTILS
jgi:hypothetical protein